MLDCGKKFLILGSQNAIGYREIFPLIRRGEIRLGYYHGDFTFRVKDDSPPRKTRYWQDDDGKKWRSIGNICWFTNLDVDKSGRCLKLTERYDPERYVRYENYDAINVDKTADIPLDYDGVMGVPLTFLHNYNPAQFEIVGFRKGNDGRDLRISGRSLFTRVLVRRT